MAKQSVHKERGVQIQTYVLNECKITWGDTVCGEGEGRMCDTA